MMNAIGRLAAFAVIAFLPAEAVPQGLPEAPLNMHPQTGGQAHWYDYGCCSLKDCAAVEMKVIGNDYVWQSWRHPEFIIRVPVDGSGRTSIKASKDDRAHACELESWSGGTTVETGGHIDGMYAICIYLPPAV